MLWPHTQDRSIIGIGYDKPRVIGQNFTGELLVYRPKIPVTPLKVVLPFMVRSKIGAGRFAFNNPYLPLLDLAPSHPRGDRV